MWKSLGKKLTRSWEDVEEMHWSLRFLLSPDRESASYTETAAVQQRLQNEVSHAGDPPVLSRFHHHALKATTVPVPVSPNAPVIDSGSGPTCESPALLPSAVEHQLVHQCSATSADLHQHHESALPRYPPMDCPPIGACGENAVPDDCCPPGLVPCPVYAYSLQLRQPNSRRYKAVMAVRHS